MIQPWPRKPRGQASTGNACKSISTPIAATSTPAWNEPIARHDCSILAERLHLSWATGYLSGGSVQIRLNRRSHRRDAERSYRRTTVQRPTSLTQEADIDPTTTDGPDNRAERLNRGCFCITLDQPDLAAALDREVGEAGFAADLAATHPNLFSNVPIFVPTDTLDQIVQVITAIETVSRLAGYQAAALAYGPAIAVRDFGPLGVFMGYDFHITPKGPQLIEVNSNAGGAFLNALLARAQRACCAGGRVPFASTTEDSFAHAVKKMFVAEWQLQGRVGEPVRIAIVDDDPTGQFLYPEFRLAEALLDASGLETIIADAATLQFDGETLALDGQKIDLVYNRLVDFGLEEARHSALRAAYAKGRVVLTPNPHVHALLADKRNLALMSNGAQLEDWGLASDLIAVLRECVPKTSIVSENNADALWHDRRNLFFKPAKGYGSKATYRGEKLTTKVWGEITRGDYVAQTFARPGIRTTSDGETHPSLKVDIRIFTYGALPILAAARLYQGQTTNMRTPGGGFAPVLEIDRA